MANVIFCQLSADGCWGGPDGAQQFSVQSCSRCEWCIPLYRWLNISSFSVKNLVENFHYSALFFTLFFTEKLEIFSQCIGVYTDINFFPLWVRHLLCFNQISQL
jgi:hypothetical protein